MRRGADGAGEMGEHRVGVAGRHRDEKVGGIGKRPGDIGRGRRAVPGKGRDPLPRRPLGRAHRAADPLGPRRDRTGKGAGAVAEAEDEQAQPGAHEASRVGRSGLILRPAAESAISVFSRRSRVSSCLALITHQIAG